MKKLMFLSLLLTFALQVFSATHYVTVSGAGTMDGSSWANAAPGTDLQAIINLAISGDEVWVTCGTYLTTTGTDRNVSFSMKNGVSIRGSFQGNELSVGDREYPCGPCSILSGELGAAGNSDNAYTVIYNQELDSTAYLEGFIIRDGNDDRTPTSAGNGLGGGMYNHGYGAGGFCSPTVHTCLFEQNAASWGGGAFNNGYDQGFSEPLYINCVFYQNHAYQEAGGMDSYGVGGNASPTLHNCIFYENSSDSNVGAMYCWGGNANGNCHPMLYNCAFVNNTATNGYGGAFIADNLDENGVTSSGSCTVTMQNCVVWNNTATGAGPQFYVRGVGAQFVATYSDIDTTNQTGQNVISGPGTLNQFSDPNFYSMMDAPGVDGCWYTVDDGLSFGYSSGSPLVNGGSVTGALSYDILGVERFGPFAAGVDIGPYEIWVPLGIQDQDLHANDLFVVAPNPSDGRFTITFNEANQSGTLAIRSINGQLIFSDSFNRKDALSIDMPVTPGLYFVEILGEKGERSVQKVIVR